MLPQVPPHSVGDLILVETPSSTGGKGPKEDEVEPAATGVE
jgi:hypothetical protein